MKLHQYLIIIGTMVGLFSCNKTKFLNAIPNNSLGVPYSISDFQAMLDNEWIVNGVGNNIGVLPSLTVVGSDDMYLTDADYVSNVDNAGQNEYIWGSNPYPGMGIPDWDASYQSIFYANSALDGITKIPVTASNKNNWNNVKGSALFIRGFYFYAIAQVFAPPYDSSSAKTDWGIPLRLSSNVTEKISRATNEQTYNRIIADVKASAQLLPVTAPYPTRPNKAAAYAFLARIYQTLGNYQEALLYADSCLALNNSLLDYNSLDTTRTIAIPTSNPEVLFDCQLYYSKASIWSVTDNSLYNSYSLNDLRRSIYFKDLLGNGEFLFVGGCDGYGRPFFGGLATDEVYLIRAECNARLGFLNEAMQDLNNLLFKRWKRGTFIPYTATSDSAALAIILNERRKEMVFRGTRWTDLRRLNRDPKYAITLTREVEGIIYTLPPNDKRYTWPIPDDILSFNTGMPQNPR